MRAPASLCHPCDRAMFRVNAEGVTGTFAAIFLLTAAVVPTTGSRKFKAIVALSVPGVAKKFLAKLVGLSRDLL